MSAGTVVLDGKLSKLPYPLFPRFRNHFTRGYRIMIPPLGGDTITQLTIPSIKLELVEVTFSASGYQDLDSWSLTVNGNSLFDHIYTKEVGQVKTLKMVKAISESDTINFIFHNDSMTSKVIWVDLEFTSKDPIIL